MLAQLAAGSALLIVSIRKSCGYRRVDLCLPAQTRMRSQDFRIRTVDRRGRAAAHVELPNVVKLLAVQQRSPPRSRSGPAGTTTSVALPVWSWLTPRCGLSMTLVPLDVVTGIERPCGVTTAPPYCPSQSGGTIGVKIASSLSRGRCSGDPTF